MADIIKGYKIKIPKVTGEIKINGVAVKKVAEVVTYTITNNLANCVSNNNDANANSGSSYAATITPNSGYELMNVSITMGGTNVTSTVYTYQNGKAVINIPSVTGNVVITVQATATSTEPTPVTYTITRNLTNCTSSNTANSVNQKAAYTTTVTPNSGYELLNVAITMGGTDVTGSVYTYQDGNAVINIPNVTGNVTITVQATATSNPVNGDVLSYMTYGKGMNLSTAVIKDEPNCWATVNPITVKQGKEYTISMNATHAWVYSFNDSGSFSSQLLIGDNHKPQTFTFTTDTTKIRFGCYDPDHELTYCTLVESGSSEPTTYTITKNLPNCTSSNAASSVNKNDSYSTLISAKTGYKIDSMIVTMNGTDITSSVVTDESVEQEFTSKTITANLTLDKNINEETGAIFDDDIGGMYATVDAIAVKPNSNYTLHINSATWIDVYEYDSSGNFTKVTTITQSAVSNFDSTYTAPSNCKYIKIFVMSPNTTPVLTITGQLMNESSVPDSETPYVPNVTGLVANDKSAAASNKTIIQNALNSAGSGGTVSLPVGTYYIPIGLNIPANVTLEGKSAKETILQLHSPSDRYYSATDVGGNTTLRNFTYKDDVTNNQQPSTTDTSHKDNNQALLMVTGNNVTFDNCAFHNSSTWMVGCDDTNSGSNQHNNFVMKNCYNKWHKRSYYTTPFDISQVYVVSEKMTFINNTFETDAPAFSRTVFDIRGFHITMTGNKVYNFVQPALVGNAIFNARTSGLTQKHIITDNIFIGCKVGTMIYSYTNGYDSSTVLNHHYSHLEYKRNTVEVNTDVLGIGVDNNQAQSIAGIVSYGDTPNEYSGITIEGNTFNCASPNTVKTHASLITGIGLYNGTAPNIHDVNITGNTIKNFPYTGLIVGHQADVGGSTRNVSITNNIFLNNGRNATEVWPYNSHITIMDANINGLTITGNTITSDGTVTKAKFGIKEVGYNSNCSNINISNNTVTGI